MDIEGRAALYAEVHRILTSGGRFVTGADFPALTANLARNLRENRLGVLSAVLTRD
jgi:hypothetical protein